jgi:hypothetical protein
MEMLPLPTPTITAEESARDLQTPDEKQGVMSETDVQPQPEPRNPLPTVAPVWHIVLAAVVVLGASVMVLMRQAAASRWRRK